LFAGADLFFGFRKKVRMYGRAYEPSYQMQQSKMVASPDAQIPLSVKEETDLSDAQLRSLESVLNPVFLGGEVHRVSLPYGRMSPEPDGMVKMELFIQLHHRTTGEELGSGGSDPKPKSIFIADPAVVKYDRNAVEIRLPNGQIVDTLHRHSFASGAHNPTSKKLARYIFQNATSVPSIGHSWSGEAVTEPAFYTRPTASGSTVSTLDAYNLHHSPADACGRCEKKKFPVVATASSPEQDAEDAYNERMAELAKRKALGILNAAEFKRAADNAKIQRNAELLSVARKKKRAHHALMRKKKAPPPQKKTIERKAASVPVRRLLTRLRAERPRPRLLSPGRSMERLPKMREGIDYPVGTEPGGEEEEELIQRTPSRIRRFPEAEHPLSEEDPFPEKRPHIEPTYPEIPEKRPHIQLTYPEIPREHEAYGTPIFPDDWEMVHSDQPAIRRREIASLEAQRRREMAEIVRKRRDQLKPFQELARDPIKAIAKKGMEKYGDWRGMEKEELELEKDKLKTGLDIVKMGQSVFKKADEGLGLTQPKYGGTPWSQIALALTPFSPIQAAALIDNTLFKGVGGSLVSKMFGKIKDLF